MMLLGLSCVHIHVINLLSTLGNLAGVPSGARPSWELLVPPNLPPQLPVQSGVWHIPSGKFSRLWIPGTYPTQAQSRSVANIYYMSD